MPIIRKQLKPADVYPETMRYDVETDTVQTLINDDWVDSPESDPRNQTLFPPRSTSDPACDGAQSVTDAFKLQIDGVLTAISGAQSAFTIAGIILSLFTFGVFGVFISLALFLAHAMLDAGTVAISASLTPEAYDTFTCILFCHMDSSGRVNEGELPEIKGEIDTQIGGVGAVVLNAMLSLAGEGGVNNLASLGTSTGDCAFCPCEDCQQWFFNVNGGGTEGNFTQVGACTWEVIAEHTGSTYTASSCTTLDQSNNTICSYITFEVVSGTGSLTNSFFPCGSNTPSGLTNINTWLIVWESNAPLTIRFTSHNDPP